MIAKFTNSFHKATRQSYSENHEHSEESASSLTARAEEDEKRRGGGKLQPRDFPTWRCWPTSLLIALRASKSTFLLFSAALNIWPALRTPREDGEEEEEGKRRGKS